LREINRTNRKYSEEKENIEFLPPSSIPLPSPPGKRESRDFRLSWGKVVGRCVRIALSVTFRQSFRNYSSLSYPEYLWTIVKGFLIIIDTVQVSWVRLRDPIPQLMSLNNVTNTLNPR
jgi:hypothetical protein